MITIGKPYLQEKEERFYLISHIKDEKQGVDADIWYSAPKEYGRFFTPELSDAFLVGALMPAILQQEDIIVEGTVTDSLYHNITETIAPLIQNSFKVAAKNDCRDISWGGVSL